MHGLRDGPAKSLPTYTRDPGLKEMWGLWRRCQSSAWSGLGRTGPALALSGLTSRFLCVYIHTGNASSDTNEGCMCSCTCLRVLGSILSQEHAGRVERLCSGSKQAISMEVRDMDPCDGCNVIKSKYSVMCTSDNISLIIIPDSK